MTSTSCLISSNITVHTSFGRIMASKYSMLSTGIDEFFLNMNLRLIPVSIISESIWMARSIPRYGNAPSKIKFFGHEYQKLNSTFPRLAFPNS